MHVARFAGFGDDVALHAQAGLDQGLMDRASSEQHRNAYAFLADGAIGENDHLSGLVLYSRLSALREFSDRLLEARGALADIVSGIEPYHSILEVIDIEQGIELVIEENRRLTLYETDALRHVLEESDAAA